VIFVTFNTNCKLFISSSGLSWINIIGIFWQIFLFLLTLENKARRLVLHWCRAYNLLSATTTIPDACKPSTILLPLFFSVSSSICMARMCIGRVQGSSHSGQC
jgi:hypothetical protein